MLGALAAASVLVAFAVCLRVMLFLRWHFQQTAGDSYHRQTAAERRSFQAELAGRGRFAVLLTKLAARLYRRRRPPQSRWRGVAGPPGCQRSFGFAASYAPGRG
jgi:hypothetical protein